MIRVTLHTIFTGHECSDSQQWQLLKMFFLIKRGQREEYIQTEHQMDEMLLDLGREGHKLVSLKEKKEFTDNDQTLSDCIVAAFDTPEKLMEPDMTMKYIPTLKEQGKWTEHARVSPDKLKELEEGPETLWPETPRSAYDFAGFNFKLLGSKVAGLYL